MVKRSKNNETNLFASDEQKEQIILQKLAENNKIDLSEYNLNEYSKEKSLYDYQQEALENAFSILNIFYKECQGDKDKYNNLLRSKYEFKNLDIKLEKSSLLKEYFNTIKNDKLEFKEIINQMCFWMATGSGKTVVIVKLIEMLGIAMDNGFLPKKNIYFFTANDDLLNTFQKEVKEYNENADKIINLYSLKDYEKRSNSLNFGEIDVFYYGAYNLCEEKKDKQIDFKDALNNGDNYVILDEAHKGDKSYSKMQHIMSILSKNGFLFNFSATFTSSQDIAMTALNLNASEWIKRGYGKKPLLLKSDLSAFKEKEDFNEKAKQKAILKSLMSLYLCKVSRSDDSYHDPMMLVFSNSVTAENSDAHLFFKTIETIAKSEDNDIFEQARNELVDELKECDYLIKTDDDESLELLSSNIAKLKLEELKEQVFHSKSGNIEAIYHKNNKNEIIFKLDSVEMPFMLIRIGNITEWLKTNLKSIKITESFKNLEMFNNIDDSSINILLGSRMFSEGWNTTRPNVSLYLNIGVDKDAKTFVTQSLGRTLRVESYNGDRRRAAYTKNKEQKANIALETAFVFATNTAAIKAVIESTNADVTENKSRIKLEKNPKIANKKLLIPTYKQEKQFSNTIDKNSRIRASKQNQELAKIYASDTSNALIALKHNILEKDKVELVKKLCQSDNFLESKDKHYKNINTLIKEVEKCSIVKVEIFDSFKVIKDEIRHFEQIGVIEKIREKVENEIKKILKNKNNDISNIDNVFAKYKYLEQHYYNPLICEKDSKNFSHIIKVRSEIDFLDRLNDLCCNNNINDSVNWWFFSKIEERVDDVYIPYIKNAVGSKFYPDFVFWIEKKNGSFKIVFVDPKGISNADYQFKCDGYKKVFINERDNKEIEVELWLIKDDGEVAEGYKDYWLDVNSQSDLMKIFK